MVYLLGVHLSNRKLAWLALADFYGIGQHQAKIICNRAGIGNDKHVVDLTKNQLSRLSNVVKENLNIGNTLRRDIRSNIMRLRTIGCYRGVRHSLGLPSRGQRTHTNAQTKRRLFPRQKKVVNKQPFRGRR